MQPAVEDANVEKGMYPVQNPDHGPQILAPRGWMNSVCTVEQQGLDFTKQVHPSMAQFVAQRVGNLHGAIHSGRHSTLQPRRGMTPNVIPGSKEQNAMKKSLSAREGSWPHGIEQIQPFLEG